MYHQFRLDKTAAHLKTKRNFHTSLLIIIPLMLGIVAFVVYTNRRSNLIDIYFAIGFILFAAFVWMRAYRRGRQKLNLLIDSYVVVVKEHVVIRRIEGYPEIAIPFSQIKQITKYAKGHFTISTADARVSIHIPETVENVDILTSVLQQIRPIQFKTGRPFFIAIRLLLFLLPLAAFVCIAVFDNKWIVGAGSVIALVGLGWLFYYLHGNEAIPAKTRLQLIIFGVLLLLIVLARLVNLLGQ